MNTNQKFLGGIIIGVAAGAAILFLTKTKKGNDLLDDLSDAASSAKDKASDYASKAKSKASDFADDAKDTWQDKFESLEKQVKYLAKKGRSFIDDLEDKAKDITSAIKGF